MVNTLKNFKLHPLVDAKFINTSLATYEQNGVKKSWEIVQAHDSVAILIYHKEKDAFVLVEQYRPAVYLNNDNGLTIELCAGIVDKNLSLEQIAKEEIEEECGYDIALGRIEEITSFHTSVGFAGSKQILYYAEVDESMKVSEGGGVDAEMIEVVYLPIKKAKALIYDVNIAKTPGLMFAFMWWFEQQKNG
jgi:UDP-sugar diphosphatase